jgi:CDP-glucose 4,6-dehydratase
MKVVILCGGEGTRMREETEFKPKPLVEVGGKPILWHIMKIYAHYGFNEFILTLGYKGNMIKDYFLNWRTFANNFTLETGSNQMVFHNNGHDNFKITFVDTGLKSLTGERVRRVKDYIDGDEFMLTYGDGVADINIPALLDFHHRQGTVGTITGTRPSTRFGMLQYTPDNKISGFKQNNIAGNAEDRHDYFVNGGFMVFKKEFINNIAPDTMLEQAFPALAEQGQLSIYAHNGKWKFMDTYKEAEDLNQAWVTDPFWKVWDGPAAPTLHLPQAVLPQSKLTPKNYMAHEASSGLSGKNVLVTGATGLVGGHLVERLLKDGAHVVCTVRSKNPKAYFYQHKFDEQTVMVNCDINDAERVFDVVSKYEIAYIFHLAAQPIVATSFINPYETFKTNIMGTVNVLEAARKSPYIKGVVVASSDKAYGKTCVNATEADPMAGDHPYDVSKSAADLIARAYYNTYHLPVAVSRFGNIYGPGDLNLNRIVPGIMKSLLLGKTLEIRSDGRFVRDYVYVKDVVDGYMLLAESMDTAKGQAFNFSTGYTFSVLDFVQKISQLAGQPIPYNIVNNQQNEIPFQSLNYQKAESVLGWKPKYTFEQGMRETYEWYKGFFGH